MKLITLNIQLQGEESLNGRLAAQSNLENSTVNLALGPPRAGLSGSFVGSGLRFRTGAPPKSHGVRLTSPGVLGENIL